MIVLCDRFCQGLFNVSDGLNIALRPQHIAWWNLCSNFSAAFVDAHYNTDADVRYDGALQRWFAELSAKHQGNVRRLTLSGLLNTKQELGGLVLRFFWLLYQHTLSKHSYYASVALDRTGTPGSMRDMSFVPAGEFTMETLFSAMPDSDMLLHEFEFAYLVVIPPYQSWFTVERLRQGLDERAAGAVLSSSPENTAGPNEHGYCVRIEHLVLKLTKRI